MKYKTQATNLTQDLQNKAQMLLKRLNNNAADKNEVAKVLSTMVEKSRSLQNLIELEREEFGR